MSQTATHEVLCACGATVSVFCADSINAERHPHMRDAVLARTLHVFQCEACLGRIVVDKPFVYVDLARRQLYGVHPAHERAHERVHGEALMAMWARTLGPEAGVAARSLFRGDSFHVRLCYGAEELREKLVAHDAGLRDLVVEAIKAEVLASSPELRAADVIALRLDEVRDDVLVFLCERATDPPSLLDRAITVDRARYDELAAVPWTELCARMPGIAAGPHVSMLRWTVAP